MNVSIIQARMSSTRLPGKVMREISGYPMLWHVVERCRCARRVTRVLVATSTNADDDVIADFCAKHGISCHRGALDNVLLRYVNAAKDAQADTIVRITGDCPLIDPGIIDECVAVFEKSGADYVSNVHPERTVSRGLDVEVIRFSVLERANTEARLPYEREHVTPYIWENKKKAFIIGPSVAISPRYRCETNLSVDYPADFEVLRRIYAELYRESEIIDIVEAIEFLRAHPEITALNADSLPKAL